MRSNRLLIFVGILIGALIGIFMLTRVIKPSVQHSTLTEKVLMAPAGSWASTGNDTLRFFNGRQFLTYNYSSGAVVPETTPTAFPTIERMIWSKDGTKALFSVSAYGTGDYLSGLNEQQAGGFNNVRRTWVYDSTDKTLKLLPINFTAARFSDDGTKVVVSGKLAADSFIDGIAYEFSDDEIIPSEVGDNVSVVDLSNMQYTTIYNSAGRVSDVSLTGNTMGVAEESKGRVQIKTIDTGSKKATTVATTDSVSFSPDGAYAAAVEQQYAKDANSTSLPIKTSLTVYSLSDGKEVRSKQLYDGYKFLVGWSPGSLLGVYSEAPTAAVSIINPAGGQKDTTYGINTDSVSSVVGIKPLSSDKAIIQRGNSIAMVGTKSYVSVPIDKLQTLSESISAPDPIIRTTGYEVYAYGPPDEAFYNSVKERLNSVGLNSDLVYMKTVLYGR